jgi:hypothetical protein
VGSNPAQGMDVCPRHSVLSLVGKGLATGQPLVKESYQLSKMVPQPYIRRGQGSPRTLKPQAKNYVYRTN